MPGLHTKKQFCRFGVLIQYIVSAKAGGGRGYIDVGYVVQGIV